MTFDPDAYLRQEPTPQEPPASSGGFDPDAYLAAKPSTPLPTPRPEEAPSMTPAVAHAPLPSERPEGAPPRASAAVPTAEDPSQGLYNELESVGWSFKRGVHSLRQGGNVLMAGAEFAPPQQSDGD